MSNQASEDELSLEIDGYIDDIRYNNEVPFDERLESAKKSIKHLVRTEKLKLLAEVRERVIGENERGTITNPDIPSYGEQYESTLADKDELRAELAKLEAEL